MSFYLPYIKLSDKIHVCGYSQEECTFKGKLQLICFCLIFQAGTIMNAMHEKA